MAGTGPAAYPLYGSYRADVASRQPAQGDPAAEKVRFSGDVLLPFYPVRAGADPHVDGDWPPERAADVRGQLCQCLYVGALPQFGGQAGDEYPLLPPPQRTVDPGPPDYLTGVVSGGRHGHPVSLVQRRSKKRDQPRLDDNPCRTGSVGKGVLVLQGRGIVPIRVMSFVSGEQDALSCFQPRCVCSAPTRDGTYAPLRLSLCFSPLYR
ncbi:hypothetical protein AERO8C_140304 [Aeromonas veronii]|uniref:Uncharacterized protein n=1 Tax=Aeromonas veronii TaxID=654 RepID=A0A653KW25_AERVE|nr:hypothetical protein AERO8C_140304 [Aeromonas veronii]